MDEDHHHHNPHWAGDHSDELIKQDGDLIHISAKALNITWGNDSRFWKWVKLSKEESCLEVGGELIQVNYMEVTGSLNLSKFSLSPSKTYEIIYNLKFKVDAFGWHSAHINFAVITPDGHKMKTNQLFENYRKLSNELQEVHGGEFTVPFNRMMGKMQFSMYEIETDWWKGGLILEGVMLRPKAVDRHNM